MPRTALFRRLDRARRPVVCIVGPPGSGKSVLAASSLRARRVPLLWYQLEPDDADLATFFCHLGAAGMRAGRGASEPRIPPFTSEFQHGPRSFARLFFQRLYGRLRVAAGKRVEGILSNSRRRHFGHAAMLAASCVAVAPAERGKDIVVWLAGLRETYKRHHGFREELTRAIVSLGLKPIN